MNEEISQMRRSYGEHGLSEESLLADPIEQFKLWLTEAATNKYIVEPNAMVLSTIHDGGPISRTVLLKDVSTREFSFFTNYSSRKGGDISRDPKVSLLFPWYPMERQVIITGNATKLSESESASYFATRPWNSQIGAWASDQSQPLDSRGSLEVRWKDFAEKFPEGTTVPKPPHWGGYSVTADTIEFWQGRYSRLHDRIRYIHDLNGWKLQRFFP